MTALLEDLLPSLTLPRTALLAALQAAERIVPAKSPLPVLAACCSARGHRAAGHGQRLGGGADRGDGRVVPRAVDRLPPPAARLTAYVASLSSPEVHLTLKEGRQLEVRGGASHALLSDSTPTIPLRADGGRQRSRDPARAGVATGDHADLLMPQRRTIAARCCQGYCSKWRARRSRWPWPMGFGWRCAR